MRDLKLDRYDIRILEEIQNDGRISRIELGERINLSPSQCYRRLKLMEDAGLIDRYIAVLDREKAGFDISAIVMVKCSTSGSDVRNEVIALINSLDEVLEGYGTTGEYDLLLKVYCPNMKSFTNLITNHFQVEFIADMHSYIMTDCFKFNTQLPIKLNK